MYIFNAINVRTGRKYIFEIPDGENAADMTIRFRLNFDWLDKALEEENG